MVAHALPLGHSVSVGWPHFTSVTVVLFCQPCVGSTEELLGEVGRGVTSPSAVSRGVALLSFAGERTGGA